MIAFKFMDKLPDQINKKLDLIAGILLKIIPKGSKGLSYKEQIRILYDLGMGPTEIAKILNWDARNVGTYISSLKKNKQKKK